MTPEWCTYVFEKSSGIPCLLKALPGKYYCAAHQQLVHGPKVPRPRRGRPDRDRDLLPLTETEFQQLAALKEKTR